MTLLRTLLLSSLLAGALPAATIRIDPASVSGSLGGIIDLSVSVSDVTDLYAYQFDVAFDAEVLSASAVTEAAFLSGGGATFFLPGAIDNAAGTISFTVNTLLGPAPGANGSGSLAGIRFAAEAVGTSRINLSNVLLLDSAGNDIAFSIENGSVSVGVAAVPEPGSAALFMGGIVVLLLRRKRPVGCGLA